MSFISDLQAIFPPERCLLDGAALAAYESDGLTAFAATPRAMNQMNRILRLDPEARLAVVEPGVINLAVSQAAAPHGLYFAPDPSSQQICTIGGNVAFNSGGAHCLKYGMTANHVIGATIVTPTGEILECGGESVESLGPDCLGLFCGSEGLFGIALELTLRLIPKAEVFHTLLAGYDSTDKAGEAVSAIIAAGILRL